MPDTTLVVFLPRPTRRHSVATPWLIFRSLPQMAGIVGKSAVNTLSVVSADTGGPTGTTGTTGTTVEMAVMEQPGRLAVRG
jgi:hypothetical protein